MKSTGRQRFVRRADRPVVAVQLSLDTKGLVYRKWGAKQRAKPGDWIVDNGGDVYTVDARVFVRTYRRTAKGAGTFVKTTPVWAKRAERGGVVKTKEGVTHYKKGDYMVSNRRDGSDGYAMTARKFERLYVRARKKAHRS